jgi:hypothetical protein
VYVSNDILKDEYNHLTTTFDGRYLKMYVNGVLSATTDSGTTQTITYAVNNSIYIGAEAGGGSGTPSGNYIDGQISNAKVFDVALTATQVADLYNNPEKVVPTGVDNTALKLWLPMMEGAGTTAYDGSAPLTDYVTNGDFSDGTNNWTASNATLSVEGGALKITSTGGNRPQANQTITGLTIGRKYLLSAVARVGTTPYNMEIEIAGIGASGPYNKTTNSTDTYIYYEFTASSTSHQIQAKIDNDPIPIGETGYFDDIKLLDLGNYGTISGATWVQGIGGAVAQSAVIDWNKMVPDHTNEILVPQGLTAGRDLLGNLFENVRKQGALNLDGNSRVEVHDNASLDYTSAATLEAWVYWTGEGDQGILGRWFALDTQRSLMLYASDSDSVRVYYSNDGIASFNKEASQSLSTGNWYHFVTTYDGSNIKIYVNAVQGNSAAYSSDIYVSSKHVDIGTYQGDLNKAYNGQIAQPRIYNRALTASEVLNNYNATKAQYQ